MKDKVLIRKQVGSGVQQFQTVGGEAPSFMDLYRRVRDPNAGRMSRIGAGLGMAGKVGAGLGTIFQTAHQLQGGNALAPFGVGYTYEGLDPTVGMRNPMSREQQVADKVRQMQINQQAKEQFEAMQQPQQEAAPSTSTTDFPNRSPTMEALSRLDPMGDGEDVVGTATEALQAMPFSGGQPLNTDAARTLGGFGLEMQPTGPAQPQQTLQPNPPTVQTQLPEGQPPQPEQVVPQGQPYAGTPMSMIDPATGRPRNQRAYFKFLQRQQNKSFATYVLDEFGDMLHKADPHVAGLLAFRVYMDKMMR